VSDEPNAVAPARNADHAGDARARLMTALRKPKLLAVVGAHAAQLQAIEDAAWDLLGQTLDGAVGAFLDKLGRILGLPRGGLADDADYRACLRAIVAARRSSGTLPQLLRVAALALAGAEFHARAGWQSVLIAPAEPFGFDGAALAFVLGVAAAAGYQVQALEPLSTASKTFTLSSDPMRAQASADLGFADDAQTTGGHLAGVRVP
jgi:uncharacterized protein YmfQ (DUF2313 family)